MACLYGHMVLSAGIGLPWAAGTLGSSWTHPSLQSQQSLYDPMSQSHGRLHPRLHELAEDQLHASGRSQSPESGSWYNVPFGDAAQPAAALAAAGTSTGVQYQHRRPASEQAVQPQVAVRDSSVDFDMDTGFSDDDDAPPPLPAEPPPGSVSTVPLSHKLNHFIVTHTLQLPFCPACGGWGIMHLIKCNSATAVLLPQKYVGRLPCTVCTTQLNSKRRN